MALQHPIAAYTAASNLEAYCIREMLQTEGIETAVVEDESRAGVWAFGHLAGIHKPQVWVEEADAERARPLIAAFERRQIPPEEAVGDGPPIHVVCEECRRTTTFPANRLGRVETCAHCGAFIDVGDDPGFEGWDVAPELDEGL